VATSAGALFGLLPVITLIGAAIWMLIFWMTRYVSLASITAAVMLPLLILIKTWSHPAHKPLFYFSLFIAAIVIWRHRSNLSRLVRGTEPRFTRK
jgi:glycerol-3-phosphate acyltransferase PlsY